MAKVIVIRESLAESVAKDAATVLAVFLVIGTGWWLGSVPMQWLGFLALCLGAMSWAAREGTRLTPQQAADLLWQTHRVRAGDTAP